MTFQGRAQLTWPRDPPSTHFCFSACVPAAPRSCLLRPHPPPEPVHERTHAYASVSALSRASASCLPPSAMQTSEALLYPLWTTHTSMHTRLRICWCACMHRQSHVAVSQTALATHNRGMLHQHGAHLPRASSISTLREPADAGQLSTNDLAAVRPCT